MRATFTIRSADIHFDPHVSLGGSNQAIRLFEKDEVEWSFTGDLDGLGEAVGKALQETFDNAAETAVDVSRKRVQERVAAKTAELTPQPA